MRGTSFTSCWNMGQQEEKITGLVNEVQCQLFKRTDSAGARDVLFVGRLRRAVPRTRRRLSCYKVRRQGIVYQCPAAIDRQMAMFSASSPSSSSRAPG